VPDLKQADILVLGSSGLLGQALIREARKREIDALGLARGEADIKVDMVNSEALLAALDTCRPTTIINAAGLVDIEGCERDPGHAWLANTHVVGTLSEWCRRSHARLVQISTDHYFTGNGSARHSEDAPVVLCNVYARTKFAAEALALSDPASLVLRVNIAGIRGWKGRPTFAEWAITAVTGDQPVRLFDDMFASTLDTATCARAVFDLIKHRRSGLVNLASGDVFNKKQFVETLADQLGCTLTKASVGSHGELSTPRAESLGLSVTRAESLLGYKLPGLEEVVASIVKEYRNRNAIRNDD
jgi:dTDP-4-dehydrorhamnose reductase